MCSSVPLSSLGSLLFDTLGIELDASVRCQMGGSKLPKHIPRWSDTLDAVRNDAALPPGLLEKNFMPPEDLAALERLGM